MIESLNELRPGPRFNPDLPVDVRYSLFDIDNTLVSNNGSELPTERFLAAAHEAGGIAIVGVATARPLAKAEHIITAARMDALSILSNGAQIYDGRSGEMRSERVLPAKPTHEIIRALQAQGVDHWVQDDGIDYRWLSHGKNNEGRATLGSYVRAKNIWQPANGSNKRLVFDYEPARPLVIVAHDVQAEQIELMSAIGAEYAEEHVTALVAHETVQPDGSKTYEVFFLDDRANKKEALQTVSEMTGIAVEHTMATGDGPNDAVIVEYAGIGVALDNAVRQTKEVASYIAPSREQDGAAIALEELVTKPSRTK